MVTSAGPGLKVALRSSFSQDVNMQPANTKAATPFKKIVFFILIKINNCLLIRFL